MLSPKKYIFSDEMGDFCAEGTAEDGGARVSKYAISVGFYKKVSDFTKYCRFRAKVVGGLRIIL